MSTSVPQARRPAAAPSRRAAVGHAVPAWTVTVAGLLAAVVITAVALLAGRHGAPEPQAQASPPPTAVVAEIDGQKIPLRELALYLAQDRAATFAHFQQAYGATDGPHFWTTPRGGQTPADYLKKRALADVTRATVVLELAHRHQLIADPGYDAFLTAWNTENARRRQAVAAHQVIYGPAQYTEANYFTYVLHDLDASLEQVLTQAGTIPAPESALRAYYRSHLATFCQQDATTHQLTTPRFGQVVQQVRQAYVYSRYQAMTADLAGTARLSIDKAVLAAVPVGWDNKRQRFLKAGHAASARTGAVVPPRHARPLLAGRRRAPMCGVASAQPLTRSGAGSRLWRGESDAFTQRLGGRRSRRRRRRSRPDRACHMPSRRPISMS